MTRLRAAVAMVSTIAVVSAAPARPAGVHGVWVWNTAEVTSDQRELARFVTELRAIGATDAYLYLQATDYAAPELSLAVAALSAAGLRTWGLDGARAYFSDTDGPVRLYAAADALADFNKRHKARERFYGFVSDMEPQDGQAPDAPAHFHNGLADSRLTSGQAAERQALLADWLAIHQELNRKMRAAGLHYAAAVPSWADNYDGEPIHVTIDGRAEDIQPRLMALVHSYIVMSYSTSPGAVVAWLRGKIGDAGRLGAKAPRVYAALETHAGAGRGVTYADDPVKHGRAAVLKDIAEINRILANAPRFGGVDIHDWAGWSALPP